MLDIITIFRKIKCRVFRERYIEEYIIQSPKTTTVMSRIAEYALSHSNKVVLMIIPKFTQYRSFCMRELLKAIPPKEKKRILEERSSMLYFDNGTRIVCKSAEVPIKFRGLKADMVVIDDAEIIDFDKLFEILREIDPRKSCAFLLITGARLPIKLRKLDG